MNKDSKGNKILNFFENRGFYIILVLCVVAIGISGYVLFFSPSGDFEKTNYDKLLSDIQDNSKNKPVIEDMQLNIPDKTETANPQVPSKTDDLADAGKTKTKTETTPKAKTENSSDKSSSENQFYVRPLPGKTIKPFSETELVFSKTMNDWRVHTGSDIEAKAGDRVYAIADGTVSDVYFDDLYGYCVKIEHAGNVQSLYAGLMKNVPVKKGDKVTAGSVIGGVGDTNISESLEPVHLHIEVTKDNKQINPESLYPKKQ